MAEQNAELKNGTMNTGRDLQNARIIEEQNEEGSAGGGERKNIYITEMDMAVYTSANSSEEL